MTLWLPIAAQRPWGADPDVKVIGIGREGVAEVFPVALPLLAQALTAGRLGVMDRIDAESLYRLLTEPMKNPETGEEGAAMQLFAIIDTKAKCMLGALVTEIISYPRKRVFSLALIGGVEAERWIDCIHDLELWAKDQGCEQVEVPGRIGWQRVLRGLGYQPVTYTCAKEIA